MAGRKGRQQRLSKLNFFKYPKRKAKPPSPREKASFLQVLFVSWMFPLIKLGLAREITEHDLYPTLFDDQSDHIGDKLEILWGNHIEECQAHGKTPSLVHVLVKAYFVKFIFFGLFSLAEETIFRMIQVIAVGYVLDYFEGNYLTTLTGTLMFGVGGILLGSVSFLISFHWSIFNLHHCCTHIRLGLSSLVYRKILRLNQASMRSSAVGQIITLIASDLHRFDRKHIQINYIWIAPVHLGVVIYILYFHYHYGITSLTGLAVLLIFALAQYFMAKTFLQMRQKRVDSSDKRIRAVVEIINAFYTIKVHCWEKFFHDKAMDSRKEEIKFVRTTLFLKLLNTALGFIVTKMSVFMTLLFAFIFEEPGTIHSKRVFVTLVLYEHVRVNFMILFPHAINDIAELLTSCRRTVQFLMLEELETPIHSKEELSKGVGESGQKPGIRIENMSCRWFKEDQFQLKDFNINIEAGQLVIVAGPVASGKSLLVAAILGEISPEKGSLSVVGRIAYVPQTPQVFPGSIRRNIIFGYGINMKWYNEVIRMCGLQTEFSRFPHGDQSLTENTQLTNGQRAKICMARALYANADVYILDDPLHSMDVRHHHLILDTVIQGALRDKAVLLVTHQIHFLEEASQIVLIDDGEIQSQGTYSQLLEQGISFQRNMEDEFDFIEVDEEEVDDSSLLTRDLVPALVMAPQEVRRRGSITFIKDSSNVKKVSQEPGGDRSFGRNKAGSMAKKISTQGPTDAAVTTINFLAQDDDAYDAHDILEAPRKLSLGLYYHFLRAGSSRKKLVYLLFVCIISQVLYTVTDLWLEDWSHSEEIKHTNRLTHPEKSAEMENDTERTIHICIYSALVLLIVGFSLAKSVMVFRICMKASTTIFEKLLDATVESRMYFFERTCAGHAINRLSKDMAIIDDLLPPTLLEVLSTIFEIIGALCIVAIANFWFIIPAMAFILANLIIYRMYHLTAADLKRIEGNARTPVYSHLSRTLQGVTTIRAFGQEQAFVMIFDRLQDNHTASWYLFVAAQSWLAVVVDCVSVVLIACISFSFFYLGEDTNPATVGLTISKMIELSILVQFAVGEISNTETQMISVERVLEYAQPNEIDQFEIFEGPEAPEGWPSQGRVEMKDLCLDPSRKRKRELKHINLTVEGGQRIGVVGRAGSGKSTLVNALFRIAEARSGTLSIDGVDIKTLGLQNLRKRISIIPQNPCMFAGTVRQNIDPLNEYTDDEIWDVLRECTMFNAIQKMDNGLNSLVTEYGVNFSAGQRQFICLGRALLEKNKILCCDEPTACLDSISQMVLMCKLKEHFANSTIFFVAHQINSLVDCDRIIVLEGGAIVEEGEPLELLQKTTGPFFELVKHLGQKNHNHLVELARDALGSKRKTRTSVLRRKTVNEFGQRMAVQQRKSAGNVVSGPNKENDATQHSKSA